MLEAMLSEAEIHALLDAMFPHGFAGSDVRAELTPEGWEHSPLSHTFHPTVERVWEEAVQLHRNVESLLSKRTPPERKPQPTLEEIRATHADPPWNADAELRQLVGQCLWDVFSDNHEVIAGDTRVADMGSWRASGGFIAEHLNRAHSDMAFDYMDFFMGTIWRRGRADLSPVYQMIFRRLRQHGFDWHYHFPKLSLVDFRPLRASLDAAEGKPEWATYSPAAGLEQQEKDKEIARMQEELDEAHRQAIEEAKKHSPPATVEAYRTVYGHLPRGWPPQTEG